MNQDIQTYLFSFYDEIGKTKGIHSLKTQLLKKYPQADIHADEGDELYTPCVEIRLQSNQSQSTLEKEMRTLAKNASVSYEYGTVVPDAEPVLCPEIDQILDLMQQENWAEAEKVATSITQHENPNVIAEAYYFLYIISDRTDRLDKALEHLQSLTEGIDQYQPTSSDYSLLVIAYCKRADFDQAQAAYAKGMDVCKKAIEKIELNLTFMQALVNESQLDLATTYFQHVLDAYKEIKTMDETHLIVKLGPDMIPLTGILELGVPVLKSLSQEDRLERLTDLRKSVDDYGRDTIEDFQTHWDQLKNA